MVKKLRDSSLEEKIAQEIAKYVSREIRDILEGGNLVRSMMILPDTFGEDLGIHFGEYKISKPSIAIEKKENSYIVKFSAHLKPYSKQNSLDISSYNVYPLSIEFEVSRDGVHLSKNKTYLPDIVKINESYLKEALEKYIRVTL